MVLGNRASAPSGITHVIVSGEFVVRAGGSQIGARPGKPIRYEPIIDGEIVLDYGDKQYQWHGDLPDYQNPRRD